MPHDVPVAPDPSAAPAWRAAFAPLRLYPASLRGRLVLLVAITAVPLMLITALVIRQGYADNRLSAERDLTRLTESLAQDIDQEARTALALLNGLALSPRLRTGDMAAFRAEARSVMADYPGFTVTLTGADATPVDATHEVPGAGLPVQFTSPLVPGSPDPGALGILMPLPPAKSTSPDGPASTGHTLGIVIDVKRLQALLTAQSLPSGWVSVFLDQTDRVVARNQRPADFLGTTTTGPIRTAAAQARSGVLRTRDAEGTESTIAFARAPITGFFAAIAIPSTTFEEPLRRAMLEAGLLGLAIAIPSLGLALLLARSISRSLQSVASSVATGAAAVTDFGEIANLAHAFQTASRQRNDAMRDLLEQEQRLQQILDATPVAILVLDRHGAVTYANRLGRTYFQSSPLHSTRETETLVHPADRRRLQDWRAGWLQPGAAGQEARAFECRIAVAGNYRWHMLRGAVLQARRAKAAQYLLIALDVHDTHAARDALAVTNTALEARVADRTRELSATAARLAAELTTREQMQAALLQSQKQEALGRLTAGVAHDFNNALAAVSSGYEAIDMASSDATVREAVAAGRIAVDHAASLVRHLLSFARQQPLTPEAVVLAPLLAEFATLCRQVIGKQTQLAMHQAADLWPVHVDAQMLKVALLNLAANARDAMPDGGTLTIAARNLPADNMVEISIADTGRGMSPTEIAHATEPFYTTKPHATASGLGLATVDGFAVQSQGRLQIESTPGAGTRIALLLPRASVAATPPADTPPAAIPAAPPQATTILLVDDHQALREATALLLRTIGYQVLDAPGADLAYDIAMQNPQIALVITDVVMPGGNGVDLAARLHRARPALPVMFITGFADSSYKLEGQVVLRKPFAMRELTNTIRSMLPV